MAHPYTPLHASMVSALEVQQQFFQIEEDARKASLAAAEQRGAASERERIRLELLAVADATGDPGCDDRPDPSEVLRAFARRLEPKP